MLVEQSAELSSTVPNSRGQFRLGVTVQETFADEDHRVFDNWWGTGIKRYAGLAVWSALQARPVSGRLSCNRRPVAGGVRFLGSTAAAGPAIDAGRSHAVDFAWLHNDEAHGAHCGRPSNIDRPDSDMSTFCPNAASPP